jgi:hypothetical protein
MASNRPTSMIVDVRPGESLELQGGLVTVELLHKSGQLARLRVTAPPEVSIRKQTEPHGAGDARTVPSMV